MLVYSYTLNIRMFFFLFFFFFSLIETGGIKKNMITAKMLRFAYHLQIVLIGAVFKKQVVN